MSLAFNPLHFSFKFDILFDTKLYIYKDVYKEVWLKNMANRVFSFFHSSFPSSKFAMKFLSSLNVIVVSAIRRFRFPEKCIQVSVLPALNSG